MKTEASLLFSNIASDAEPDKNHRRYARRTENIFKYIEF